MTPHLPPLRHSLSIRLFLLTIGMVLAVEVLIFVPELVRQRDAWLNEGLEDAHLVALVASIHPDLPVSPAVAAELLRLSNVEWVSMEQPGQPPVVLSQGNGSAVDYTIELRREMFAARLLAALRVLTIHRPARVRVFGEVATPPGTRIGFVFRSRDETRALRRFAGDFFWTSVLTAGLTGALVYVVALLLLVRPMRRIIDSIAAFREAPEHSRPLDPREPGLRARDELAEAGQELAAMQAELRTALWRNARLAAVGNAVARIGHDLRGILVPALLAGEKLEHHSDDAVRQAGERVRRAVDRATDLVGRTLDFVQEGPPPLETAPIALAPLVEEAGEAARGTGRGFTVVNEVLPGLTVEADRNQFFRVLANLLRNAAAAGASSVRVSARATGGMAVIDVADDGPGLPDDVRKALFRPFSRSSRRDGTGLGLAIARDLTLAHGGEITLASTGPGGTTFRLTLRMADSGDDRPPDPGMPGATPRAETDP